MSDGDRDAATEGTGDEPFLARWSRLKAQARHPEPGPAPESGVRGSDEPPAVPAAPAAVDAASPEGAPAPVQLPDLEQLHEDSDYSAFLTPGVDVELRKRALRKLFHSPKFNVFDGLDTYRDDFTSFPALGSIVTADMRYHLERAARELAERAADAISSDPPPADTPPPVVTHEPPAPADPLIARNEDDAEHGPA
jgi:hypothetical protein